jgi:WhiB family redox-sensing transcriptional regulator
MAAITTGTPDWNTLGNCRTGDPDRLFVTGAKQREARRICRGCPVIAQCLAMALDERIEFGVWGGMTERERRSMLKTRPDVTNWSTVLTEAMARRKNPTLTDATEPPAHQPSATLTALATLVQLNRPSRPAVENSPTRADAA